MVAILLPLEIAKTEWCLESLNLITKTLAHFVQQKQLIVGIVQLGISVQPNRSKKLAFEPPPNLFFYPKSFNTNKKHEPKTEMTSSNNRNRRNLNEPTQGHSIFCYALVDSQNSEILQIVSNKSKFSIFKLLSRHLYRREAKLKLDISF